MTWKEECLSALHTEDLFIDYGHRTRFKELLDCFSEQPFFTSGLCKCMYLSAWDDGHFFIMLGTLNQMALARETSLEGMRFTGDILASEQQDAQYYAYLLANSFLDGTSFSLPDEAQVPRDIQFIIRQAQKAAAIIDQCFDTKA